MTFLLQLRDAAKQTANEQHRQMLRDQADTIAATISAFSRFPSVENMIALNGEWALGARMLKNATGKDNGPTGGSLRDGAELQQMAA